MNLAISHNPRDYRTCVRIGFIQNKLQQNTFEQVAAGRLIVHAVNDYLIGRFPQVADTKRDLVNLRATVLAALPAHAAPLEVFIKVSGLGAGSARYHALLCVREEGAGQGAGGNPRAIACGAFTHIFRTAAAPGLGMPEELRDALLRLVSGAQMDGEGAEQA